MDTIDKQIEKILQDCPILSDTDFQKQYPGILSVAGFLDSSSKTHYQSKKKFKPFDDLGVDNITGYIAQIK